MSKRRCLLSKIKSVNKGSDIMPQLSSFKHLYQALPRVQLSNKSHRRRGTEDESLPMPVDN